MGNTEYKPFAFVEQYTPGTGYSNTAMQLTATKNDCADGYEGSSVTLTADANHFVSPLSVADANAQADAWLNANAQAYANNLASCVVTRNVLILNNPSVVYPTKVVTDIPNNRLIISGVGADNKSSIYFLDLLTNYYTARLLNTSGTPVTIEKTTTNRVIFVDSVANQFKYIGSTGSESANLISSYTLGGSFDSSVIDSLDNFYLFDNDTFNIIKITPTGTASVLATVSPTIGTGARMAISGANIYLVGVENRSPVIRVTTSGVVNNTFATLTTTPSTYYRSICCDSSGNIYINTRTQKTVYKITSAGILSTFYTDPWEITCVAFDDNIGNPVITTDEGYLKKISLNMQIALYALSTPVSDTHYIQLGQKVSSEQPVNYYVFGGTFGSWWVNLIIL